MMLVSAVIWLMTEVSDCVEFTIWDSCSCMDSPFSSSALIASACVSMFSCSYNQPIYNYHKVEYHV